MILSDAKFEEQCICMFVVIELEYNLILPVLFSIYIENKYKIVYYEKSSSMHMSMYFGDIFHSFCLILYSYIIHETYMY